MTKLLLLASLLVLPVLGSGCLAPPGYSAIERYQMIGRNWDYEGQQAVDDWDHIMLFRPASHNTIWNVR